MMSLYELAIGTGPCTIYDFIYSKKASFTICCDHQESLSVLDVAGL